MLLGAFTDGRLPAAAFDSALMKLWEADGEFASAIVRGQVPESEALPGRPERAEEALRRACAGQMEAGEFGHTWAAIWGFKRRRPSIVAHVVNILHDYGYRYTANPALLAENPTLYIDEAHLRQFMIPLRDVVTFILLDD
jgi:hypothetical protein